MMRLMTTNYGQRKEGYSFMMGDVDERFGDTSYYYQACAKIEGVRYDRMTFGLGFFMYDFAMLLMFMAFAYMIDCFASN